MKKRAKTLSVGFSVGLSAFAVAVLAATPASAALHPLSWHVNKSRAYIADLPTRTAVQQMYKAQEESAFMALQADITTKSIQQAMTASEITRYASSKNWPGPGH
ncbi:hypothetical protein [Streptomyces sp. NPDC052127]|uniref:hypothetical protein n=1 Tax=Streptomyces sp. NPDC052127 TaxID=3155679 RepID=UPI003426F75E